MTIGSAHWRWVILALSASIALAATRFFFVPPTAAAGGAFGGHLASHGLLLYAHAGGGAVALIAGAIQWVTTSRRQRSTWHRLAGLTYVLAIAIGGLAGLGMAGRAFGGPVPRAGFSMLAVAWLSATMVAFAHARAREWAAHRAWMIRSFSLTFAAVTLRIWMPVFGIAGVGFETAYALVAWLCWVPNLLVAEWLIAREQRTAPVVAR